MRCIRLPKRKPVAKEEKKEYLFDCDIDHPFKCDLSKCHKCGFNPIEKERRKRLISNNGLSVVKKIKGQEIRGLKGK